MYFLEMVRTFERLQPGGAVILILLAACLQAQALSIPPRHAPQGSGPPPHLGAPMASDMEPRDGPAAGGLVQDPSPAVSGARVAVDPGAPPPVAHEILSQGTVHPDLLGFYTDFAGRIMSQDDGTGGDIPPPSGDPDFKPGQLWSPPADMGMKRDEWLKCHGMSCDELTKVKENLVAIGDMYGTMMDDMPPGTMPNPVHTQELLDGCIHLTLNQTNILKQDLQQRMSSDHQGRFRRKVLDFNFFSKKWEMPITYKFDGMHDEGQKQVIRNAFQHWMEQTCLRFREVDMDAEVKGAHILVTKEATGCHSFIGRVNIFPQQLNLQHNCLWEFGIPVHEIGHAIGFWHEQQRSDRDGYIQVQWPNVDYYASQFYTQKTASYGVPYDVGSVMHYAPMDGSNQGKNTMETLDPLYQSSMGQKTGLSWLDAKLANEAYCQATCSRNSLPRACERGGYQDPNDCYRCRCPDGFSGKYCEQVAPSKKASCGGVVYIGTSEKTISSPGYDTVENYEDFTECTWLLKAPVGHQVSLRFEGEFGAYCHYQKQCYHWVEVKYKTDWAYPGPRFCCYQPPSAQLTSDTEEMAVIFRTNYTTYWRTVRRGFNAVVKAVPKPGFEVKTDPTTTTSTTTTTTTTSPVMDMDVRTTKETTRTTATARTTTTTTTTPAPPPGPSSPGCNRMDLGFVIDSSGSIGQSNWRRVIAFIQNTVRKLEVGPEANQIGMVSYGNRAEVNIYLDWYRNKDHVNRHVNEVAWKDQWTNTSGGLWLMHDNLFRGNYGKRSDALQVAVLVTDGQANVSPDRTIPEAMAARKKGIFLLVVGVGPHVSDTELQGIAGDYGKVLHADSFYDLREDSMATLVLQTLCDLFGTGDPDERRTTTRRPEVASFSWACDFEEVGAPLCGAEQDSGDQFDWTLQAGNTPSQETGPDKAYSGRYYIFIEASNPRRAGDKARLLLPEFDRQGEHCVRFNYHMYGFHIRRLSLEQSGNFPVKEVWTQRAEQGFRWMDAAVTVTLATTDRLSIEAERGDEYSGDIAVDNIRVTSGPC